MENNKKPIVFLDLDGVIANMTKAACKRLNISYPSNFEFDEEWLYDQVGRNKGLFWSKVRGFDFWAHEVEPYNWAEDLIDIVDKNSSDWVFLTKSSQDTSCPGGKYEWVKNHFHKSNRLWIANGSKSRAASPGKVLIDDKLKNGEEWVKAGGHFIHWKEITDDYNLDEVVSRLTKIKEELCRISK